MFWCVTQFNFNPKSSKETCGLNLISAFFLEGFSPAHAQRSPDHWNSCTCLGIRIMVSTQWVLRGWGIRSALHCSKFCLASVKGISPHYPSPHTLPLPTHPCIDPMLGIHLRRFPLNKISIHSNSSPSSPSAPALQRWSTSLQFMTSTVGGIEADVMNCRDPILVQKPDPTSPPTSPPSTTLPVQCVEHRLHGILLR